MAQGRRRGTHAGSFGGRRVSGLRARPPLLRVVVAALVVAFTALAFTGLWSSVSAESTVQAFLLDWQQQNYAAAAALTTGRPAVVAAELRSAYRGLDAASFYLGIGAIRQSGRSARAQFTATVDLGQDGAPWVYNGRFSLVKNGLSWKIDWSHLPRTAGRPSPRPRLQRARPQAAARPGRAPAPDAVAGLCGGSAGEQAPPARRHRPGAGPGHRAGIP
jgi:hypothetical protein